MVFKGTIFVEGKADSKFIKDFVKRRFDYDLKDGEIQDTKGKDNLKNILPQFQKSTDQGLTNLLIFDADSSFEDRNEELKIKRDGLSIQFELFLFPNNHDNGDLECLLERIINSANQAIFDCFDGFNTCVQGIEEIKFEGFDKKSKIYTYINILAGSDLAKEEKRNYLNEAHWLLQSEALDPLYNFLSPYFDNK